MGDPAVRLGVAVLFSMVALALIVSGIALMAQQPWWDCSPQRRQSSLQLHCCFFGRLRELDAQGAYAILINVVIVVSALVLHWPKVAR